jgi:hypothetical protein
MECGVQTARGEKSLRATSAVLKSASSLEPLFPQHDILHTFILTRETDSFNKVTKRKQHDGEKGARYASQEG